MRLLLSVLLGLVLSASHALPQQADKRARQLVDGWITAAGGPKLWDSVHDVTYTVTTVWYDSTGQEQRRRPRKVWIRKVPGAYRVRVERTEANGAYVQVWNGKSAWATLNGKLLDDTVRAVRETEYVAGDLSYWIGLPWKLRDPGVNLSLVDSATVAVTFGTGVGLHDRDRFWYYWRNPASPYPTDVHYIEQGKTENDRERVVFSDWKTIGPAVHVGKRLLVDANGRPLRALLISDVVINRGVADSLFVKP